MTKVQTTGGLHLKYRPQTLDDVAGNEDLIAVLKKQLENPDTMPRAILFHGPTGCGKTTLGRIVANEIGVGQGDLNEIDSADFRGIESIRDIRKQSAFSPLNGKYRMWILDEVHRLTGDAQSALLKALEDTPNHIRYILCTTDPQKLLPAIRGRCSQMQVSTLSERDMKKLLNRVVKEEGETLSKELYQQITDDSLGHPRNALQILSQVLAVDEDRRMAVAKRTAETTSETIELCRALVGRAPWKKVAGILNGLKDQDEEGIRRAVLGYCQAILLKGGSQNDGIAIIMQEFLQPFYNTGYPGLVFACYSALYGE